MAVAREGLPPQRSYIGHNYAAKTAKLGDVVVSLEQRDDTAGCALDAIALYFYAQTPKQLKTLLRH